MDVRPRVLLIEDHRLNMELMRCVLGRAGFEVDAARTGAEALQKAKAMPHDVILLDIRLPDTDGLELAMRLKSQPVTAHTPIVAVTAETGAEVRDRAFKAGCAEYMLKPIDIHTFADDLTRVMTTGARAGDIQG